MDPQLLLPIVAPIAIGLLVFVSWRAGGLRTAALDSGEAAARIKTDYHPDFVAEETLVAADGRTALLHGGKAGTLGLVSSLGDRFLTRTLGPGEVKSAVIEENGGDTVLVMRLDDFTCPKVRLPLPDRAAGEPWLARARKLGAEA